MIVYPNSGNISLFLLRVKTAADAIGNQSMRLVGSKMVVGMMSSITFKEFYASKESHVAVDCKVAINAPLYDQSKFVYVPYEDKFYRVERAFQKGMWMELSLSESDLKKENIEGWNL